MTWCWVVFSVRQPAMCMREPGCGGTVGRRLAGSAITLKAHLKWRQSSICPSSHGAPDDAPAVNSLSPPTRDGLDAPP